jgi:hypothetical protein
VERAERELDHPLGVRDHGVVDAVGLALVDVSRVVVVARQRERARVEVVEEVRVRVRRAGVALVALLALRPLRTRGELPRGEVTGEERPVPDLGAVDRVLREVGALDLAVLDVARQDAVALQRDGGDRGAAQGQEQRDIRDGVVPQVGCESSDG